MGANCALSLCCHLVALAGPTLASLPDHISSSSCCSAPFPYVCFPVRTSVTGPWAGSAWPPIPRETLSWAETWEESSGAILCFPHCVLCPDPRQQGQRSVVSQVCSCVCTCHCRHRWYLKTCSRFSFLLADKFWAASGRWQLVKSCQPCVWWGWVEPLRNVWFAETGFGEAELAVCRVAALPGQFAREGPPSRHLLPWAGLPDTWASHPRPATATATAIYPPVCSSPRPLSGLCGLWSSPFLTFPGKGQNSCPHVSSSLGPPKLVFSLFPSI